MSQEQKRQTEEEDESGRASGGELAQRRVSLKQTASHCSVYRVRQVYDLVLVKYDVLHKRIQ